MLIGVAYSSNPIIALVVAVVIVMVSRPMIRRVAILEGHAWLVPLMTVSLVLHLCAAPAQIFVVNHFYSGIADWLRYDNQGIGLAGGFRHLDFSLANANLRGIVNDGSVSIAAGLVFAVVGSNPLAAFLVFSWLAFIGTVFFFRAFAVTFKGADPRRYAYLVFLFPSLIFWNADVSKEAIMTFSLGILSYGAAKILVHRRGGFILVLVGVALGILIRPNELLMVAAGFTVAMLVAPAAAGRSGGGGLRLLNVLFFGTLLAVSVYLTLHYLHSAGSSLSIQNVRSNNVGSGGSGGVPYSSGLAGYPQDIYVVLFDPLPINFHGFGQIISALENTLLLGLVVASLRQLRMVPRAWLARPYVLMCTIYSLGFIYAFAALGNLGLITRERTLLFPFLFVLVCIPRAPRHHPPLYLWELKRNQRRWYERAGTTSLIPTARPAPPAEPGPGELISPGD